MIVEVIEFKSKHSVTESFSDTEYLSHFVLYKKYTYFF